jgi:ATP-dependent DNA ligase
MKGVVTKRADSPYDASRGVDCIKTKPEDVHDGWERPRLERS